jgi:hypothetical protein
MLEKDFASGRIRRVTYEPREQHLELTWDNKDIAAYRPVPHEIYNRLCNMPNPATYFEDRIAEEYPRVQPKKKSDTDGAAQKLKDLFGN